MLARTAEVVEEAEAGRLAQTAERARDALTAMRSLLETVRDGEQHAELRPQPTLQALDLLVGQCRATGRQVEVRLTDRVPERLLAAVDIAAYRAAETILQAGGDEPAVLVLDTEDRVLTLTANGVSRATRLAARRRLVRPGPDPGPRRLEADGLRAEQFPLPGWADASVASPANPVTECGQSVADRLRRVLGCSPVRGAPFQPRGELWGLTPT